MVKDLIITKSGKINDYLHHIDLKAYGTTRMLSIYLAEFNNYSILLDCGSSLDYKRAIRYFKKNNIPLSSFKYLITSHHHFDHNGGIHLLYKELKKYSPELKILTNQKTKVLLNNYSDHLNRARRTYGDLVGQMEPIEDDAFKVIEPKGNFHIDVNKLEILDKFNVNGEEIRLTILKTPGHTPDHQSPVFLREGKIDFIFLGEAVGTIYHATELLTMPTSMPIYYNHADYMNTLNNLKNLEPLRAGYGHFGVINGKDNVQKILLEHEFFLKKFRSKIIEYYKEKPETKYVVNKILPILTPRTDLTIKDNPIFKNIALGIVYGMMIDLGYRDS
jgi:glyoxylase-like metal-dependent hydrolase (beta-lactamase superfamily II)